jgi:hypothetical protein
VQEWYEEAPALASMSGELMGHPFNSLQEESVFMDVTSQRPAVAHKLQLAASAAGDDETL